jgi:hypothetical protein
MLAESPIWIQGEEVVTALVCVINYCLLVSDYTGRTKGVRKFRVIFRGASN